MILDPYTLYTLYTLHTLHTHLILKKCVQDISHPLILLKKTISLIFNLLLYKQLILVK